MILEKKINLSSLFLSFSDSLELAYPALTSHQQKTAYIAWEIGKFAGLPEFDLKRLFMAALLHDVGALSAEEKASVHRYEEVELEKHCLRGELLLNRIPYLNTVGEIVRYHHREWQSWDLPIENPSVLLSQILFLSDSVERIVNQRKFILDQVDTILERTAALKGKSVHSSIVDHFTALSQRESFWFNLASPKLPLFLFNHGPIARDELSGSQIENISKLFRDVIDFKSPFTATHTSGVSACAEIISHFLGISEHDVQLMRIAGNFHDMGKIGIPNRILEKTSALTEQEMNMVRAHTYFSYHILNSISGMETIAEWSSFHHERLDGTGYPFHIKSDRINTGSRIIAVADVFTALREDRPYRKGLPRDEILSDLKERAAMNSLDKNIVKIIVENINEIEDYVQLKQEAAQNFYTTRFLQLSDPDHFTASA